MEMHLSSYDEARSIATIGLVSAGPQGIRPDMDMHPHRIGRSALIEGELLQAEKPLLESATSG